MSEFDQLYREVILDHYKNRAGDGVIEGTDATPGPNRAGTRGITSRSARTARR